ncbi:DinB family protein [Amycolatopsis sp. NPDC059657]|uniref:DinB family protein n=1 Tax=Amycolatopsis sp. NPDC059657 TaxID=3346899 RepID=UPI003672A771
MDWTKELADQLDWHWNAQLRPRMAGLTDDEYLWEPVPGCWTVHPGHRIDWAWPPPDPAPVTTIAWRLGHIIVGVFGMRNHTHFGGPAVDYVTFPYAQDAETALRQLDDAYALWMDGVRGLSAEALAAPSGEPGFEDYPLASLILHIHREVIHHGAEISLLRDLYAHR